ARRVEQRPESGLGREATVEDGLAAGEAGALLAREAGDRVPWLDDLRATGEHKQGGNRDPPWGHGFGTSTRSMRSATSPVSVRWHAMRTTSPGLNSTPARPAVVSPGA